MFFESIRLKIDIEIFNIFDKQNFNIDINCNLMTINNRTKNKKIENRQRLLLKVVLSFTILFIDLTLFIDNVEIEIDMLFKFA